MSPFNRPWFSFYHSSLLFYLRRQIALFAFPLKSPTQAGDSPGHAGVTFRIHEERLPDMRETLLDTWETLPDTRE
jgi:hypothetical protein